MTSIKTISRTLLLAFAVFLGCETEKTYFTGPYFVRFTNDSNIARESMSDPVAIEIHNGGPAPSEDLTVTYKIGGNAREGTDYEILGNRGTVVIPKGKYSANIQVQLLNNANNILGSQNVTFTLTGSTSSTLHIGQGESSIGKTFTLTILDDCLLGGSYQGIRSAFDVPVKNILITSDDCEHYTLSNFNVNLFNSPFDFALNFIDNGDNSLTIPKQDQSDVGNIIGSGVVDPVTRRIDLTVQFLDFTDQPKITLTLIPD